jgi:hypothetical protein
MNGLLYDVYVYLRQRLPFRPSRSMSRLQRHRRPRRVARHIQNWVDGAEKINAWPH